MKTRISALMDGELDGSDAENVFNSLRRNPDASREWDEFHLIRDSLRGEHSLDTDLVARVMARLDQEPVVLAPVAQRNPEQMHPLLALAATLAGVAVVAWVALGNPNSSAPGQSPVLAAAKPRLEQVKAAETVVEKEKLEDYLLAHHAHAPVAAVASGARYVRTVSMERSVP